MKFSTDDDQGMRGPKEEASVNPQSARSMQQTAAMALAAGKLAEAEATLRQLLQAFPNHAPAHFLLGAVAHKAGRLQSALDHLTKARSLDLSAADPFFLTGLIHQQLRQLPQAIAAYQLCLIRRPADAKALNNLGRALLDTGNIDAGLKSLEQAVVADPQNTGALNNLGEALRMSGRVDAAIAQYRQAIAVDPACGEAHCNLGTVLAAQNLRLQAIASFERAIAINPKSYNALFNLTRVLQDATQFDAALARCRQAIAARGNSADAHNVLGNLYGIMGQVSECIAAQKQAIHLQPGHAGNHSNLLLSLQYRDDLSIADRFAAHRQWDLQHTAGLTPLHQQRKNLATNQKLRIGYLSPNFQSHSVAYFIEPALAARDRSASEVFCYSNTRQTDDATHRFRKLADHWREIAGLSDIAVAELIAEDAIDILIDLAGHTSGNRLPVFAYKPAPVQMSWIGYPDTTGMAGMDYRLTDAVADPPGESARWHSEKLIRIPGGCWVYSGPGTSVLPSSVPVKTNGFVTFGSFNNLPKVTPQVLESWAQILRRVPRSRLILKAAGLSGTLGREYVLSHLQTHGVQPDRIDLLSWAPSTASHLDLYSRIDIAFDTFPYNGTTTTCEALWMGVPVITFSGDRHVARVGASLLTHGGFPQWIAADHQGYMDLAVRLADQIKNLSEIRSSLRTQLAGSPLCDATRMARELDQIFHQVALK